ncbi:MAG: gas vesicle protein GvpO [Bacteroidota bacterium]
MMNGPQAAQAAKQQLMDLTGHPADSVSAMRRDDDGWAITVELVELKRIPESSDLLATYEASVNDEGILMTYQRTRRYQRHQVMEAG